MKQVSISSLLLLISMCWLSSCGNDDENSGNPCNHIFDQQFLFIRLADQVVLPFSLQIAAGKKLKKKCCLKFKKGKRCKRCPDTKA